MKLSTETILTDVYGVPATPVQRAACRARDGLPLAELRDDPDVVAAFGGADAIAALPSERGIKPSEFWNIASARTAKTTIACAGALADSQSIDLRGLGPGEIPRITILSVKVDVADVPYRRLRAAFDHPAFKPLLVGERESDRMLQIRNLKSRRIIEACVSAGGQAGSGLANRWSAGVVADEAPKMNARADERATNLDDALSVARERMLDGSQIECIGSPWRPMGTAYDMVQTYFGKPTDDIVVMRTTGPAGNPSYWTEKRLEALREKDEVAWRINALGEFLDPESGLLSPTAVRTATRAEPLELLPDEDADYAAAVDVGRGRWTLIIVEGFEADDERPYYRVALAREFAAHDPTIAWQSVAETCRRYGVAVASVDQYAASESRAIAQHFGLELRERPWHAPNKLEAFENLATLVHAARIELAPERTLRRDLLSVKKRTTQQGFQIHLPHTTDGRHCDFAPALAAALREGASRFRLRDTSLFTIPGRCSERRGRNFSGLQSERLEHVLKGR